jgi:ABC-type xylose transport system permease subunit
VKASNHPTGIAAAVAMIMVIVAQQFSIDLSPEVAAGIVGLVAAIVSKFTPRHA